MMERYRSSETDVIADLQRRIRQLENELQRLSNRSRITIPVYDKAQLPPLLDQEIYIGTDHTFNFTYGGVSYNAGP